MDKKNLATVTMMLATFLLAIPVTPAVAAPMADLRISPAAYNSDLGQSFTATVMVSNAPFLVAFDFSVRFDPNILQATGTSLTGTLLDPAVNPTSCVKADVFNTVGFIRFACLFKGGTTGSSSSGSLLIINFQVNNPLLGTSSELPSAITIKGPVPTIPDPELVGLSGGTFIIPHTTSGAVYAPGNSMGQRSVGCRATIPGWSIVDHGFTDGLFCRITNNGVLTHDASALFNWKSLNGITGSAMGSVSTLAPGQNGESDASITFPFDVSTNDIFIVTGTPLTIYSFPDGTTFLALGTPSQQASFKIVIN